MRFSGCLYFPAPSPLLGSQTPALAPNLCLLAVALTSNLYLSAGPGPPICIYRPWHPICIYGTWPPICIKRPWPPICIYRPWLPICICRPWPTILLPFRSLSLHIPTLSPQFIFVFTALAYDLYYRSGAWICIYFIIGSSSGRSNSSSSNFFGKNKSTNICVPILVNYEKQNEAFTTQVAK